MKKTSVIGCKGVSKKFCRRLRNSLWYGVMDLLGEVGLARLKKNTLRKDEFWALSSLNFEVFKGETLGLIGHNGAGKSTLLKVMNGLLRPDMGSLWIDGRVGALIELGAGFNPLLTGRENIYVNAAILGFSGKETEKRMDSIIDFAEIGDFIDAPIYTYSSGMKVRLGFAVATNLNPDILLIDEILSVGDASFRQRCVEHLANFKKNGGTIILVSHNSVTVESISDRIMLLDHGTLLDIGEPYCVMETYQTQVHEKLTSANSESKSNDKIKISGVELYNLNGEKVSKCISGESFEVRISYALENELSSPYFIVGIRKGEKSNPLIASMHMMLDGMKLESIPRAGVVSCLVKNPMLSPGNYYVHVAVQSKPSGMLGEKFYFPLTEMCGFTISPGSLRESYPAVMASQMFEKMSPLLLPHSWQLNGESLQHGPSIF